MSTIPTQVPVTIATEVRGYVAELGRQTEQMLEYVLHHVADMQVLDVRLRDIYESGDVPCVLFDAHPTREEPMFDDTHDRWLDWFFQTSPVMARGLFVLRFALSEPGQAG